MRPGSQSAKSAADLKCIVSEMVTSLMTANVIALYCMTLKTTTDPTSYDERRTIMLIRKTGT